MNKKNLIIIAALLVISTAIIVFIFYTQSLKNVAITITKPEANLVLYSFNDTNDSQVKVTDLKQSTTLQLGKGTYGIVAENSKYNTTPLRFGVANDDVKITVDPSLSDATLAKMLNEEIGKIKEVITTKYQAQLADFSLEFGNLYKEGQWYATILKQKVQASDDPDIYRIVLKKDGDIWKIAAPPALTLSAKAYPSIPADILYDINRSRR